MREFKRLSHAARLLPGLCVAGAGLLLGKFAVGWWPQPVAANWALPQADAQYAAGLIAPQHWFGAGPEHAVAATSLNVKVFGVWAPLNKAVPGVALLEDNGQRLALRVGKTLPSGWTLARVQASGVLMRQAAAEQFIPLRRPEPAVTDSAAAQAGADFVSPQPAGSAAGLAFK